MFEFTCFRSTYEKLLNQMLFDIETDVLQNSVKSSVLVKLLYVYSSAKDNSLSSILSENFLEEYL